MNSNNAKRLGGIGAALLLIPALALADSGVGVDTWRANKLDPTGGMASQHVRRGWHDLALAARASLTHGQSLQLPTRVAAHVRTQRLAVLR